MHPANVNSLEIEELESGYILKQTFSPLHDYPGSWPRSICMNEKEVFFSCADFDFNEFGYFYLALHIAGNFARYYPDEWVKHIERSSPLALAIDELCLYASQRLPLLLLSELERCYYVPEA